MKETQLQQACVRWFRYLPVDPRFLIAVPNEGIRTRANGGRLKAQGMMAGVSDLILFHPKGQKLPIFLECKLPGRKITPSQSEFCKSYQYAGYTYHVFTSFDQFKNIVEDYIQ